MKISSSGKGNWILRFKKPTPLILQKIEYIIDDLKANSNNIKMKNNRDNIDAICEGDKKIILLSVKETLQVDYSKNLMEARNVSWLFDYVIMPDDVDSSKVEILTRFYHPEKEGSIYYGRTIKKISANHFILWIDE